MPAGILLNKLFYLVKSNEQRQHYTCISEDTRCKFCTGEVSKKCLCYHPCCASWFWLLATVPNVSAATEVDWIVFKQLNFITQFNNNKQHKLIS